MKVGHKLLRVYVALSCEFSLDRQEEYVSKIFLVSISNQKLSIQVSSEGLLQTAASGCIVLALLNQPMQQTWSTEKP